MGYLLAVRSIAVKSRFGMLSRDSSPQSVKMRISRFLHYSMALLISGVNLPIFISDRLSSIKLEESPSLLMRS